MQRKIIPDVVNNQDMYSVSPDDTVTEAAKQMAGYNVGAIIVTEGDALRGILSERDIMKKIVAGGLDPAATKVSEIMTADPDTLGPDSTSSEALEQMNSKGYRHLPVVDSGKVVGMVSIRDLYNVAKMGLEEDLCQAEAFIHNDGYGVG